jgi:hypothetical protein
MIINNNDLYAAVKGISSELQQAGEAEWSLTLREALSISSVPGEILGEIRLQLQLLRASETALRLDLGWQIDEMLSYLNEVLR